MAPVAEEFRIHRCGLTEAPIEDGLWEIETEDC